MDLNGDGYLGCRPDVVPGYPAVFGYPSLIYGPIVVEFTPPTVLLAIVIIMTIFNNIRCNELPFCISRLLIHRKIKMTPD
jgi:hypothetical protein